MLHSKLSKSAIFAVARRLGVVAVCAVSAAPALGTTIFVNAQDDIFLAGQSTIPNFAGGAGLLPPSIAVSSGGRSR